MRKSRTVTVAGTMALVACALAGCMAPRGLQGGADSATGEPALPGITIVLVGDSTVEAYSGWGPGFAKLLKPEARCINWARGGRSSRSYMDEGWWKKALADRPDYVLIQFGHNDMPGKGLHRETDPKTTYPEQMGRYVDEARAAGAEPILITSMTRRHFGRDGRIHSDLIPYADTVKKLAKEKKVALVDLHARSIELLDRLGPEGGKEFQPTPKTSATQSADGRPPAVDATHLSAKGADVMGRIVAEELKKIEPRLALYFK